MSLSRRSVRSPSVESLPSSSSSLILVNGSDAYDDLEDFTMIDDAEGVSIRHPISLDVEEGDNDISAYFADDDGSEEQLIDLDSAFLFDDIFESPNKDPPRYDNLVDLTNTESEADVIWSSVDAFSSSSREPCSKPSTSRRIPAKIETTKDNVLVGKTSPILFSTESCQRSPKRKRSTSEDVVGLTDQPLNKTFHSLNISSSRSRLNHGTSGSLLTFHVDQDVELWNGTFLRIKHISDTARIVAGLPMKRLKAVDPTASNKQYELSWIVDISEDDYRRGVRSQLKVVQMSDIRRDRAIVFTNIPISQEPQNFSTRRFQDSAKVALLPTLYCRWKTFTVTKWSKGSRPVETIHLHLKNEAADAIHRDKAFNIRRLFQGRKVSAGGTYIFGDAFSGVGGATRGAIDAGLKPLWGVDHDEDAIRSYQENFEQMDAVCLCLSIDEFISLAKDSETKNFRVDVLHISPPCQPWSAAHTRACAHDEVNEAALFCIDPLLRAARPRVVTMEQTEGLCQRHLNYFRTVISAFMSADYSIRYRVLSCAEYGVPQLRRRLVIFASAPGETLPEFPAPTHGPGTKRPYNFIGNMINHIPRTATLHDTSRSHFKEPKRPFSPDQPAKTVTCGGGDTNYHPSGLRHYTPQEFAILQTFPLNHVFCDRNGSTANITLAKKQIGNAVPPLLAKTLFRAVVKSLKKTDGVA